MLKIEKITKSFQHTNQKKEVFGFCLRQQLIRAFKHHNEKQEFVLILDNSPVHRSKRILKVMSPVQCLFLPLDTPQLNPIEKVWNNLKRFLITNRNFQSPNVHYLRHQFFNGINEQDNEKYCLSVLYQSEKN
ncbi:unnamed protein product [Paramecium pentaurelia]|uniref:Tc1-like transposase DDE domain-containing protein n=1 Tax=Paramecium pentaurelia TaxID=43138 RepID=A0A8S1SFV2_9CILI|nr:unnamed protein product [Paramecium pentaurelia]